MVVDTKLEDLPEDILCGILSRLPMTDAARASASCAALLRAWRGHAHLVFDGDTLGLRLLPGEESEELFHCNDDDLDPHQKDILEKKRNELATDFVRFVDATLLRHRSDAALGTLTLRFAYLQQRRHAAFVDRWVRFAIESATTRRLDLDFLAHRTEPCGPGSLCYEFPSSILLTPAAMALEHLHLSSGCLRWPSLQQECLNLTTVLLHTVRVTSQDLERFLCSCHKLQSLELKYCHDLVYVKVPPRLTQLGSLALRLCRSVKTVDLSDSHVASLTLLTRNCQPSILRSTPAPNITRASIKIFPNPDDPAASAGTFESTSLASFMPGLESLSLGVSMLVKVMSSARAFEASEMPPGVDVFRSSPHLSLKTVSITGFDAGLASLELLLYILENARPLRRLSLDPAWYGDSVMAQSWKMQLVRDAIRRHIAPRISGDIVLEVL